jgi:hypothetical protein
VEDPHQSRAESVETTRYYLRYLKREIEMFSTYGTNVGEKNFEDGV